MSVVDFLPIGKTMFDYYIPGTSKCNKLDIVMGMQEFLENYVKETGRKQIEIEIQDHNNSVIIPRTVCEIKEHRRNGRTQYDLSCPSEIRNWFETTFVYSFISYVSGQSLNYKVQDVQKHVTYIMTHRQRPMKFDPKAQPMELVMVSEGADGDSLVLKPFLVIDQKNAWEYLDEKQITVLLTYLFQNIGALRVGNTLDADDTGLSRQFSFMADCSQWMTADQYSAIKGDKINSIPGIYTLYREHDGQGEFYTGKAWDMSTRIIAPQKKSKSEPCTVGHPLVGNEKKQFQEMRFETFQFKDFLKLVQAYQEEIEGKEEHNKEDNTFCETVLYAVEGVVNQIVRKVLEKTQNAKSVNDKFDEACKRSMY